MIELQTELMFNFVFLCAVHTPSFIQSFRFISNNAVTNFENKGFMYPFHPPPPLSLHPWPAVVVVQGSALPSA